MTITYFLGNGFDLALGLKTKYKDFLEYYKLPRETDTPLISRLKKDIDPNSPTWADAEEAFGKLPFSKYAEDYKIPLRSVIVSLDEDFQYHLRQYLIKVQNEFAQKVTNESNAKIDLVRNAAMSIEETIAPRSFMTSIRQTKTGESVHINFITLNYTSTIDLLARKGKNMPEYSTLPPESRLRDCGFIRVYLNEIVHAHGRLGDKYRLFGVNDDSQILDDEARKVCSEYSLLIKTEEDAQAPVGDRDRASSIIKNSDYIIMLGVSYGVTDAYWWNCIAENSVFPNGRIKKIILSPYETMPRLHASPAADIIRANEEIDRFYTKLDVDIDRNKCAMLSMGPYMTTKGKEVYCDPLGLTTYKEEILK